MTQLWIDSTLLQVYCGSKILSELQLKAAGGFDSRYGFYPEFDKTFSHRGYDIIIDFLLGSNHYTFNVIKLTIQDA